ncbi:MAG: DUF3631 domain-containing protein [Aeromicrobium sp.]
MSAPKVPDVEYIDGAELLNDVEAFLARFVVYPSDEARTAHVLWIMHTWFMDSWESTPRIAFLSPEPGSGKSRALEVTEPLVPRPVHAVNTTPAYLFRKVSDDAGPPTILYDEIDTVFGPKAKDNEDTRGMLNAGHRRGATAGRCVVRGKIVETEELPAYCAVALAGLDDLPDTIMSRSIVVRMRRRAPGERVEPWRHRLNAPQGEELQARIEAWASAHVYDVTSSWPEMPESVEDRDADVWEALLAVADAGGGDWPHRARCSAVALVAEKSQAPPSIGVLLLRDLREVFQAADADKVSTEDVLEALVEMDESPWGDIRGKELDARSLSRRLAKYGIKPKNIRTGERVVKGYETTDLHDAWSRYLPQVAVPDIHSSKRGEEGLDDSSPVGDDKSATSATPLQALPTECVGCGQLLLLVDGRDTCEGCRVRMERAS